MTFLKLTSGVYAGVFIAFLSFFYDPNDRGAFGGKLGLLVGVLFAVLVNLRAADSQHRRHRPPDAGDCNPPRHTGLHCRARERGAEGPPGRRTRRHGPASGLADAERHRRDLSACRRWTDPARGLVVTPWVEPSLGRPTTSSLIATFFLCPARAALSCPGPARRGRRAVGSGHALRGAPETASSGLRRRPRRVGPPVKSGRATFQRLQPRFFRGALPKGGRPQSDHVRPSYPDQLGREAAVDGGSPRRCRSRRTECRGRPRAPRPPRGRRCGRGVGGAEGAGQIRPP